MKKDKPVVSEEVKKGVKTTTEQSKIEEAIEPEKKAHNPYIAALNDVVNNSQFRDAIETIVDTKYILASKELDAATANACTLVINRELKHISEAVSRTILGV